MANAVAEADPELIRTADLDELTKQFTDEFIVEAPVLIEGALSINVEEAQIDVTGDFALARLDRDQPTPQASEYSIMSPIQATEKCSTAARAPGTLACGLSS